MKLKKTVNVNGTDIHIYENEEEAPFNPELLRCHLASLDSHLKYLERLEERFTTYEVASLRFIVDASNFINTPANEEDKILYALAKAIYKNEDRERSPLQYNPEKFDDYLQKADSLLHCMRKSGLDIDVR